MADEQQKSTALRFLIMIGVANFFADLTYEGARTVIGPFMAQLGATAATISIVSGLGEFVGYGLRAVSGFVADRTGRYWTVTLLRCRYLFWRRMRVRTVGVDADRAGLGFIQALAYPLAS